MRRAFRQVDVFGTEALTGNPVAVVLEADGLSDEQMQRFAQWTNLSETTFVLPTTRPGADYRVRIFTPSQELPFAGHPTLGTCHAWLEATGAASEMIVQECAAGDVAIRLGSGGLAFAAPGLVRTGPVADEDRRRIADVLGLPGDRIVDVQWVDNGPGWVAVLVSDVNTLLGIEPGPLHGYFIGAVALHPAGGPADLEVRAFFPVGGLTQEDPVTGSLNASVAPWLVDAGRLRFPYTARQGTACGRDGRVYLSQDHDGTVWVGGATVTRIAGHVDF